MPKGLVAIPAYNEEASLGDTMDELCRFWPREDVLVVDDGSRDSTSKVAASRGVLTLRHPTNLGYTAALQTAAIYAQRKSYSYLIFMDADGQHDPQTLAEMGRYLLASDADIVIGSRFKSSNGKEIPLARRLVMYLLAMMTSAVLRQRVTDTTSGFKAVHSRIFGELQRSHIVDFHSEFLVYLRMRGYKLAEIPAAMRPRRAGHSMHGWATLLALPVRTLAGMFIGTIEAFASRRHGKSN